MTVRSVFYTVAVLASLGTVGAVVSNPQIVQQGAALLGLANNKIEETDTNNSSEDLMSQFLRSNAPNVTQPNSVNTKTSPYTNTSAPPSIASTPFPVFPSTPDFTPANSIPSTPPISAPTTPIPTPTHNSTVFSAISSVSPSPIVASPVASDNSFINANSTPSPTPSIPSTLPIPPIPPANVFPLQEIPTPTVPAAANTEKKLPTDNTTPAHKITSNKQQNSNTDSDNNSNNFDDWSDPIFFASASTNLSKPTANSTNSAVLSSAGVDKINTQAGDSFTSQNVNVFGQHAANGNITNKTDNSVFDNEPKNINGFAPINPDSIFPNANPPSTKLANDGVILPLPPTPPSASPELPLPSVVSPVAPKLQHNSNLVINPSVISEEVSCIGTETVARVGCDVILMCDILPQLRRFGYRLLRDNMSSLTPEQRASVTEDDKNQMLAKCIEMNYQEFLKMQIEGSLVYNDFLMTMPREQIAVYEKRLNEEFDRKDVPAMIKEFRVNGNVELKRFLEEKLGSSLERERMLATRNKIIQMWVARTIQESDVESTYDELNEYYKQHLNEFTTKERVRWKEMVVLYSSFSNKQEAFKKINWLLGEVRRGVNFEGLAKLNSEGLTAPEGGVRNWTKRGDISSKIIENIIFEMPVNQISNIIEAENGLHIVIVTDHEKEKIVPFIDAQASIRKKIKTERLQKKQIEYFENLRQKYHVIILRKDFNINMATPISRPLN